MTTKISSDNIQSATLNTLGGPKISTIGYPGDDTAANPAGGQTITLTGSGFENGASVIIDTTAVGVVTVVSSTTITFTSPALATGSYPIYVVNTNGGTAIAVPGIQYSGVPTWSTAAGTLGTIYETTNFGNTVTATSDSAITYSVQSGTLPTGASLNSSNGLISGTSVSTASSTTYTFTIRATDAEQQDTDRQFSLTVNPDVVTWSSPANATSYNANINTAISNVVMSASSAAGYGITYSANTLPTGLSITGANIAGTPTEIGNTTTLLTATAATTNRTATRTISWVISVSNDIYFNLTTLLLNGEVGSTNVWNDDVSTNKFAITVNGDTRPTAFSPYETVWSNLFDGSDALSIADSAEFVLGNNFTIECWVYFTSVSGIQQFLCQRTSFANAWQFLYNWPTSGNLTFKYEDAAVIINRAWGPVVNRWYHISVCRDSSTWYLFVDGAQLGATATNSTAFPNIAAPLVIGRLDTPASEYFSGYMSNLRIVKSSLYISNFTPSTTPLTNIANTVLLTCQSNRLVDNSNNNFSITKEGDTTVSNFGPFVETDITTGSGYFDGTGDYLTVGAATNWTFLHNGSDWTIQFWIYHAGTSLYGIVSTTAFTAETGMSIFVNPTSPATVNAVQAYITCGVGGQEANFVSNANLKINQWNYVAVTFQNSGKTCSFYINGGAAGSSSNAGFSYSTSNPTNTLAIGRYQGSSPGGNLLGYISDLRISTSIRTGLTTVPNSLLTSDANTSLLTLQYRTGENNNRFVDSSGMNNIITRNGNTTQGTFTPYSLTGWSNFFDGTGDYLSNSSVALITQNVSTFTAEAWIYMTGNPTSDGNNIGSLVTLDGQGGGTVNYLAFGPISDRRLFVRWFDSTGKTCNGSTTLTLNTWHHIALVVNSNAISIYLNGVAESLSGTTTMTNRGGTAGSFAVGAHNYGSFTGYISNLRVTTTAVYTSTFTPSTNPLTAIAGTSLLTCQSNRIVDNSANNFTITRNGDVSVQSFSPFSPRIVTPTSYSGYFDGSGDHLSVPGNAAFQFTGDVTIEAWITWDGTEVLGGRVIYATGGAGSLDQWGIFSGAIYFAGVAGTAPPTNRLVHIAVTRSGSTVRHFIDGVLSGSGTVSSTIGSTTATLYIGIRQGADHSWFGYISNFRIVKGTALYTTNFTPSTTPLTAIANTSLLTCQSSTFIDNSTNNFTITVNGDAIPRSFNPFGNTVTTDIPYTVANVSGSMFFDGTGDYLTMPSQTAFQLTSGTPFCIEVWIYPNSPNLSADNGIIAKRGAGNEWQFNIHNGFGGINFWNATTTYQGGFTITNGQWQHVAVTWDGTTLRFFRNGVMGNTHTGVTFASPSTNQVNIGALLSDGTLSFYGYMSNLRMIRGIPVYTSSFVPPVTPITPIAGTTLLVNGTNGGIIDYTSKNNLETIADAKSVNTIVKYGSRSLFFDGTGDYLLAPFSPTNRINTTGNFTIEFWAYFNSVASDQRLIGWDNNSSNFVIAIYTNTTGNLAYYLSSSGTAWNIAQAVSMGSIVVNTWYHIALVRNGSVFTPYINGVAGTTTTSSATLTSSTLPFSIGAVGNGQSPFNGYIDDFRITQGIARYTANFTPPTSALLTY